MGGSRTDNTPVTERLSSAALPIALVGALAVTVASRPSVTAIALFVAAALVGLAALLPLGMRRDRSWPGWTLAAAGFVVILVAQGVSVLRGTDASNGAAVAGSTAALVGLLVVNRVKRTNRDDQGSIDATVLGVAVVAFIWQIAYGARETTGQQGASIALPLLAGFQLVALARVVFASTNRERASRFLVPGLAIVAVTTLLQTRGLSATSPLGGHLAPALSLVGWVLLATGLAHPDRASLSEPTLRPRTIIPTGRLAVLALAQSAPGAAIVINGWLDRPVDLPTLAICQVVAGLLILGRVATLVGAVERARNASRRRDRWYRQLVRHSSDLQFVIDRDCRLQFASPAVEGALGVLPGETLGTPLTSLFDNDDDVAAFDDAIARLTPTEVGSVQVRLRHRDSSVRWADLSLVDRTADPAVNGIVVNARDVTLRKRQEEEIAFAYDKQAAVAGLGRAALAGAGVRRPRCSRRHPGPQDARGRRL